MADDTRDVAIRLIQEMARTAGYRERQTVHPGNAARQIELDTDTPICDAAIALLLREGAIEPHELGDVAVGDTYGFHRITARGVSIAQTGSF